MEFSPTVPLKLSLQLMVWQDTGKIYGYEKFQDSMDIVNMSTTEIWAFLYSSNH